MNNTVAPARAPGRGAAQPPADRRTGGPATGLPTKVEQSDLLASIFGQPGDAPHVVIAPATIGECFHSMVTARRIAEAFRTVVIVLTDANLATGVQPFPRPQMDGSWQGTPPDMTPVPEGTPPYDWDPRTGLSERFVPGRPGGMHTVTGLAHDEWSRVAYTTEVNQRASEMRSRKLAVLQQTLQTPPVNGDESGELLIVGWGSTKGPIEEAVGRLQAEGYAVSSMHLRFLQPMPSGIREAMQRFDKVMTIEGNWSDSVEDPMIDEDNRRYSELAWLLRARFLVDVDCWSEVRGQPIKPGVIARIVRSRLQGKGSR